MYINHLKRLYYNNLTRIMLGVLLLIPFFSIIKLKRMELMTSITIKPYAAFFLTCYDPDQIYMSILIWFLPIYLILMVCSDSVDDYVNGYHNILISKYGKRNYVKEKYITSFSFCFFAIFLTLMINLCAVLLLFKNGTGGTFFLQETGTLVSKLASEHPYLTIIAFSLITSLLAGLVGMLGSAISITLHNKKLTYGITFLLWFAMIDRDQSLIYIIQPFAEYGFDVLIPIFIRAVLLFGGISLFIYYYEVHNYEI